MQEEIFCDHLFLLRIRLAIIFFCSVIPVPAVYLDVGTHSDRLECYRTRDERPWMRGNFYYDRFPRAAKRAENQHSHTQMLPFPLIKSDEAAFCRVDVCVSCCYYSTEMIIKNYRKKPNNNKVRRRRCMRLWIKVDVCRTNENPAAKNQAGINFLWEQSLSLVSGKMHFLALYRNIDSRFTRIVILSVI